MIWMIHGKYERVGGFLDQDEMYSTRLNAHFG